MTVNIAQLATTAPDFERELQRVLHWSAQTDLAIEERVDAILRDGSRCVFDLERDEQRVALAGHVQRDGVASLQTREFNFHEAFLKLTGTAFE